MATLVFVAVAAPACDRGSVTPTSPSAPAPVVYAVDGLVRDESSTGIAAARVDVMDGVNQGTSVMTDAEGRYQIPNLASGTFVLRASADGFAARTQPVTLSANQTVSFVLSRSSSPPDPGVTTRVVAGEVFNAANESPVPRARLAVSAGPDRGLVFEADAQGRFSASLRPGAAVLDVSAGGFRDLQRHVEVAGSDIWLEVALEPRPAPGPSDRTLRGTVVNGISDDAVTGAIVRLEDGAQAASGSDGSFTVPVPADDSIASVVITSNDTVDRATYLSIDGEPARVTLMPRTIDLAAFDQMFRATGVLHRWIAEPLVIVERRVLQFTSLSDETFVATATLLSDPEIEALVSDLQWALPQLTGDAFHRFADIQVVTADEGAAVNVSRPDAIVVARYEGLTSATSYWGYTRWAWNGRGEVRAATLMLDRAFDSSDSPYRRSLRAHELGHALGYAHVDAESSVMNSSGRVLPTTFDRHGARMAFLRPTGNRSPDVDPNPTTISRAPGALTWTGAP
jgi:hypothetical protein